ncbi:Rossmann fold nucleotide-binding protein for DNA uptake [Levilactobacillus senmaizukei DSM 21775 = NBRC 103853]|uniref:Rossmann fold nucleotide-binding protein for DNA uptake n=1 Tax=Levilactobacillus senmaizukei DSM 21775 = NBRC 103853 TaxID=1423803 RepID=A0A0R2DEV2_9LACO|nr:DNA-processing protein DprA [Levilactobacillus senmaizukei]KRN02543.1 Rossmann fold nucleotide-binding protein for DNA uptake [Levilactobacillus senmaizukei DSM 21775 = NBRC 103853]
MQLTLRDFFMRLPLISGIGQQACRTCWHWIQARPTLSGLTADLVDQLCRETTLTSPQAIAIREQLFSPRLDDQVRKNLIFGGCLTIADQAYPDQLREIYAPPVALYFRGDVRLLQATQLAVVGSRQPTAYAIQAMRCLLPAVVDHQICIVSGLAQGVDTLGHQVALAHHGQTVAVIGTGLDRCYPASNRDLMTTLMREQLVLSEYPLGTPGARHHFPERNRIIAGLARTILVVEAAHHSGSLITANIGLQENRNILAVPGPITQKNSVGTNELILAGAKPVLNSGHIIEEF